LPHLFTYGTLQDQQVQQYVFGRELKGSRDELSGFTVVEDAVYDRFPLVLPTGNPKDFVAGIAYEVTQDDLFRCDAYETSAYCRKLFTLRSGMKAWVYVENSG